MSDDINKKLVEDTFDKEYNREQFVYFIKNLLNGIEERDVSLKRPHNIQPQFQNYIKSYRRLGKYTVKDTDNLEKIIDVIEVNFKKTSSIEKARSMQRNFVARYLNGNYGGIKRDAALVAFINEEEPEDWRFSLVKMDYKIEIITDKKTGELKRDIKEELTPAKRFSFLVGKNENTHTAQQQLFTCLEKSKKGQKLTLEDLTNAFNIEKVSQEFFDEYKKLFERFCEELQRIYKTDPKVKEDFDKHNINVMDNEKNDFAKKTLGQLVFLYFIQKKRWLGVNRDDDWGKGDIKFLRNLFDKKYIAYNNFFNDILEPLFYEALATDRGTASYFDVLKCRIPFLNGGLFEPINDYSWTTTDLTIKNELFKKIFDVFDLYNFTVKEDEPLEKEIAIDPEMLGKVFENLLPENIRKGNGAFYTPREIVHYMCQESLINYLDTQLNKDNKVIEKDDISILVKRADSVYTNKQETLPKSIEPNAKAIDTALANIKICDPAIGSGAFPVGIMTELVRIRMALNDYLDDENKNRTSYQLKRNAIENSIYGVDLDSGAVEIAKLRFYLSLVVDEENIKDIRPLPNLDFKIMQGNSLISSYENIDFDKILENNNNNDFLFSDNSETIIEEIKQNLDKYINIPYATKKSEIRNKIENLMIDLIRNKLENSEDFKGTLSNFNNKKTQGSEKNIKLIEEKISNLIANRENRNFFPWKLFFADVFKKGGFDIVIGNPPYIKEYTSKQAFNNLKSSPYYQGKMDLWYFFGCIGIDLLKENGIETYIAPNNWITNSGASIFRNKVLKETQILNFVDFSDHKIFETAEIQTMIYILLKNNNLKQYKTKYYRLNCNTSINNVRLNEFLNFETNTNNDFKYLVVIDRELFINGYIEFITIDKTNIANKILLKEHINLLGNEIGQGIVGAPDECFIIKDINRFNNAEKKYIKPYFTNVDRYFYRKAEEEYIIYLSNKNFEEKNLKNYPNLYNHFLKYRKILTEAKEKYGTPNKPYYYLHREREEKFFKKGIEKIISVGRTFYPKFYYTKDEFYGSRALFFIETKRINMKYLTAFLNSKLTFFWLYNKGKKQGEQLKVDKEPLMNIPVYKPTEQQEHNIVNIVDKILSLTTQKNYLSNKQSQEQVKKYQQEIDKKIYKFYDLTQEEIDIIEKNL